jgi:hypothetical protein
MASVGQNPPRAKAGRPSRNTKAAAGRVLWPIHFKPQPDELLSSWMIRLAHAHALKIHTFGRLLHGSDLQIWNRDIDRQAPEWLIDGLCWNTATSRERGYETTLRAYEGILFPAYRDSYVLKWILPLQMYHQTRKGYGLQFCPRCLVEDREPYFRKRWRVALYTYCSIHECLLHDRCPHCAAPVIFHRREFGQLTFIDDIQITECCNCRFDLKDAIGEVPSFYDESAYQAFDLAVRRLEQRGLSCKPRSFGYYNVLHQLCRLFTARYRKVSLLEFVLHQVGAPAIPLTPDVRNFEMRSVRERHYMLQFAFWYLADLRPRLTSAWRHGAVTYSALLRDFADRPAWYGKAITNLWNPHVGPGKTPR